MPLSDEELRRIFSKRLSSIMEQYNINQVELSKILGVSESSVGKWLLQKAMPRMGVIQKLADYFNVGKSYFLEEEQEMYYHDPKVNEMAERLRTSGNTRILFDATRDMSEDDIEFVVKLIEKMKGNE